MSAVPVAAVGGVGRFRLMSHDGRRHKGEHCAASPSATRLRPGSTSDRVPRGRGSCQLCGSAPRRDYGADVCEAHHVRWLSCGGPDTLGNLVLVCPNHHCAIHRLDAPYDFGAGGFVFGATTKPLTARQHELVA